MSKRAAIYGRVSTDEQTKGYSLDTQIAAGVAYVKERAYIAAAEIREDYTGTMLDRPGLNHLRELVNGDKIDVVIVYDIDRLARKSVYQMLIEEEFLKHGVTVEYINGQYADTDEGRLQKQIKSSIAEYERAKILERGKRGKRGKAQSGFVVPAARPPYGYATKAEPHKAWFEVDRKEARVVRLVFYLYLRGDGQSGPMSMLAIAARLTAMRIPTRGDTQKHYAKKNGLYAWTAGMVRHILTNETYTGVWYYGKTKMISDGREAARKSKSKRGLGKQVTRDRSEWIPVTVPAIISLEAFAKAQARLTLNFEQAARSAKHEYLLGRRLRCAKCGYTYVGRTRRERNQYYYCKGSEQKPVCLCNMPAFRADEVESAVWSWVKNLMQNPDQIAAGLRGQQAEAERANGALRERLALITDRLADTQNQLAKLLDLYLSGDFPKELLTERKGRLEKDAADLERERGELAAYIQTELVSDEQVTLIQSFCAEVADGLDNATFEDKRQYFDLLDVRGKLAIEGDEKVVYAKCKIERQRLSLVPTSP